MARVESSTANNRPPPVPPAPPALSLGQSCCACITLLLWIFLIIEGVCSLFEKNAIDMTPCQKVGFRAYHGGKQLNDIATYVAGTKSPTGSVRIEGDTAMSHEDMWSGERAGCVLHELGSL
ncbi:hypothetical protein Droror1_Dr00006198 [Drosera rotundifolia]